VAKQQRDESFLLDLMDPKSGSWQVEQSQSTGLLHTQAKVRAGGGTLHVNIDGDEVRRRVDRVRAMVDVRYGFKSKHGNKTYPTEIELAIERARIELITAQLFADDDDFVERILPVMNDRARVIGSKMAADAFKSDRISLFKAFTNALPQLLLTTEYQPDTLLDAADQFAVSCVDASRWVDPVTKTPATALQVSQLRTALANAMRQLMTDVGDFKKNFARRPKPLDIMDEAWTPEFAFLLMELVQRAERRAREAVQPPPQSGDGDGDGDGGGGEGERPATADAFGRPQPAGSGAEVPGGRPNKNSGRSYGEVESGPGAFVPESDDGSDSGGATSPSSRYEQPLAATSQGAPRSGGSKAMLFDGDEQRATTSSVSLESVRQFLRSTIDERFDSEIEASLPPDVQAGIDHLRNTHWGSYSDHHEDECPVVSGRPLIYDTPRNIPLPAKLRGRTKKPSARGKVLRHANRWALDKRVFSSPLSGVSGTVLIDQSGSMSLSDETIVMMMRLLPAVTIAGYCGIGFTHEGRSYEGSIAILAQDGKRCHERYFASFPENIQHGTSRGGSNSVDLAALTWLAQQSKERIWISDGGVTGYYADAAGLPKGSSELFSSTIFNQCIEVVRRGSIVHLRNQKALLDYAHRKAGR
jgi:hypothetical protein